MNFQVTVLKILVSYPDGFAVMPDLKRDLAILATSGRDWGERTKRLPHACRISTSSRKDRSVNGGWRITEKGRAVLELMEARPSDVELRSEAPRAESSPAAPRSPLPGLIREGWIQRRQRRRPVRERARAKAF
ncbi:hypothetical protein QA635_08755 [Bradyrhizobium brasilense]|uniref:hypothetical protein n=1 Tax=Bradyrhizobium brasilense TaxID=1419277 RepID=UPI0024B08E65|nr:hypothetical protein [Bradyrhizobium australafricanum]WFU34482.1 hypothetical protein QA635_08755 [Bradyrhizobium australafricanum]